MNIFLNEQLDSIWININAGENMRKPILSYPDESVY